jgi:cytoskeleton protein RodZ
VSVTPVTNGLGSELREARVQHGLTLEQVAYETRIRTRYLEALEDERWDDLPGEAYAKGFLRTYADFVGLDGPQMLARYRTRFPRRSEPPVAPRPQPPYEPKRRAAAVAVGAAVVLVGVAGLVAWQLDRDGGDGERGTVSPTAPTTTARRPPPKPAPAPPARRTSLLALTTSAPSWLEVRLGGPKGKLVWVGTLQPGRRLRLGLGRRIWLRAGNPAALVARIDGKRRPLPANAADVLVTSAGVRSG